MTKYLGISGPKKSGKTTIIERLVPALKEKKLRVGTVKIAFRDVTLDVNKKAYDVSRQRNLEPYKSMFYSSCETVIFYNTQKPFLKALQEFSNGLDLVLLEGFKEDLEGIPQIVLFKQEKQIEEYIDEYTQVITSLPEFNVESDHKKFLPFEEVVKKAQEYALPLLPGLNCEHCGFKTCNDLMKAIIRGEKTINDCYVRRTQEEDLVLEINKKTIPCNPFVRSIIKNVNLALVNELKLDIEEMREISLTIRDVHNKG
ncbi:MAG: molybdopterin-guanine dinucleotide biosynthesis protein MobB [Asgard group archaeon]|nr:molybdopterin-guanine dinucleotide biosynthesis protein MobB [Asgard group archaeon]